MVTEFHHEWYAGLKYAPRKTLLICFIAETEARQWQI